MDTHFFIENGQTLALDHRNDMSQEIFIVQISEKEVALVNLHFLNIIIEM